MVVKWSNSKVVSFESKRSIYLNSGRKKVGRSILKVYFKWVMEFAGLDY